MAKNSIDAYGAAGKSNLLFFDPAMLVLVTDERSPLYDPRVHLPVDESLARNIDYHGRNVQPIAVQKNPETGETEVVVGRQRVKAARLANEWRLARGVLPLRLSGVIEQGKRQNALDVIVSENEAREDDTAMGRAEKMRRLAALGRSEDEIAVIFSCGVQTVRNTMALLDCCSAVQAAVQSGTINAGHARKLARLTPEEQREKVSELVSAGTGAAGHSKARQQRAVLGDTQPRMRTRRQIVAELDKAEGERANALRWVLSLADPEA